MGVWGDGDPTVDGIDSSTRNKLMDKRINCQRQMLETGAAHGDAAEGVRGLLQSGRGGVPDGDRGAQGKCFFKILKR